ncbi:hypothetical protein ACFLVX_03635 [Chloroflexota bacterium]
MASEVSVSLKAHIVPLSLTTYSFVHCQTQLTPNLGVGAILVWEGMQLVLKPEPYTREVAPFVNQLTEEFSNVALVTSLPEVVIPFFKQIGINLITHNIFVTNFFVFERFHQ